MTKKINLSIILIITFAILTGCNTVKKGFQNPKKNSSDEFLVEKKSPLVMPPEFNELPIPDQNNNTQEKQENKIKNLITENKDDVAKEETSGDLEGSILSKIKNK
ncbi:DUF3035 domain-containing protein [Candidatus Pelagibacter communis]|uniref:DUF3035 domain-containing protein n=1 Tax=Pelagibacter ubique TaxID=198252 RepID=UPI00065B41AE|nr:DUF3035 domain-containing protein [Candidatus Pelagibacter ubique]